MTQCLAHALFLIAAWTLVINFAFPIAWAANEGASRLARPAYTNRLALVVSVVEIVIVVTKFGKFLQAPEWSILITNWFINKVFVLGCSASCSRTFGYVVKPIHTRLANMPFRGIADSVDLPRARIWTMGLPFKR